MRLAIPLFASLLIASCDDSRPAPPDAQVAVAAANAAKDAAMIAGDAAALERFYTDDYQVIDDDANVHGKSDQLEFMTRTVSLLRARSDDVRVTMLAPDAALVTGRLVGRYRMGGEESDFVERYTSIWVRHGDAWRVRHEHGSLVPRAE